MKQGPSFNQARHSHGCARIWNDSIIVAGGWNRGPLKSTEILKIGGLKWTFGPDLKEGVHQNHVLKSNRNEYITYSVGGRFDPIPTPKIYGLNEEKNEWQHLGNMNEPRVYESTLNVPSNMIPWCDV